MFLILFACFCTGMCHLPFLYQILHTSQY
jgi:hypothetical protein